MQYTYQHSGSCAPLAAQPTQRNFNVIGPKSHQGLFRDGRKAGENSFTSERIHTPLVPKMECASHKDSKETLTDFSRWSRIIFSKRKLDPDGIE
ncbi:MAG: hypothetical protein NTX72_02965 [Candidatus Uhrbacteria bacterium]|nr:hypothetical protein [Candidatus Uhrbacteria bacterium]